jgi:hypothetical protein
MKSLNDSIETEIIIWVFKFQQKFWLSDMALEALIKFLFIVLIQSNKLQFKNFSNSLYMAKKMLNIFVLIAINYIMLKRLLHIRKREKLPQ